MATEREIIQLTHYENPRSCMWTTDRMRMSYSEWLELEKLRILNDPSRHAEIRTIEKKDGEQVALFVDDVGCSYKELDLAKPE